VKNLLILITIFLLPGSAFALQVVDVVDGKTIPIVVSLKELNRLTMADGSRIEHIWGPQDRMTLEADTDSGQLFVRAIGAKPFSLFVKADNGETYTLLAAPKDVPAETVFLRPPYRNTERNSAERALPYIKRVERLAKAMGKRALPDDYTPIQSSRVIPFWDEVHFKREIIYNGDSLSGEVYSLTNFTQEEIRLDEREFRTLPGNPIAAVAIDKHRLNPHESTKVFIIRKLEQQP
jgi:conjugal transfer pilus assembly protein TraK